MYFSPLARGDMYLYVLEQLSECQLILLFCLEFWFYLLYHFYPCVYVHVYLLVHLSVYLLIFLPRSGPVLCHGSISAHQFVFLFCFWSIDLFVLFWSLAVTFLLYLKKKKIYHCHVCGVAEVEVTELSCLKFSSIILNISKIVHFGLRGELLIKQCKSIVVCFSYMTPNSTVFYFLPMTKAYLLSK